jgi:hypothetical protein
MVATVFQLFNTNGNPETKYMSFNNECVLASFMPQMCGALVDMGTTDGSSCKDFDAPLRTHQVIQTPELFGFYVRRAVLADELPVDTFMPSTCGYVATLVHEFAHDIDAWLLGSGLNKQFDRTTHCSPTMGDFYPQGTPFEFSGAWGTQNPADFVSGYAAGLTNEAQDYRAWEDVAESVTSYILFPDYFRARAQASTRLAAKYALLRDRVFGGAEFTNGTTATLDPQQMVGTTNSMCRDQNIEQFRVEDIRRKVP